MIVYRFRFMKRRWYAYTTQKDAEESRQWLLNYGYHSSMVGPIETSGEQDFELKMSAKEVKRGWVI